MADLIVESIGNAAAEEVETTYVVNGSAKAWVLDLIGDATVSNSLNVASGTDHGLGDYSFALMNAFVSGDFVQLGTALSSSDRATVSNIDRITSGVMAVEGYVISSGAQGNIAYSVSAFGDLA